MDTITPITRAELRAKITERMERRETDGGALFTLRRGLRSLELFATPDTLGGDVALDICHAVDEVERLLSQRDELADVVRELRLALLDLGNREEFGGDAPEFNEGGEQYEALEKARTILSKLTS